MNQISTTLHSIASDIYKELGSGFDEVPLQSALAIEFRERKIPYLKEVNIELFYKGQNIGTAIPDFVLLPCNRKNWTVKTPIILESKVVPLLKKEQYRPIRLYLKSMPQNKILFCKNNQRFLLRFGKTEDYSDGKETKVDEPVTLELWQYSRKKDKMKLVSKLPKVSK
ncbi:MAG: putative orf [Candidatus Scalindua rubra]|uniref:Putative orf n=1 Tax=Candidatus Scalindua rubra TaxID=1872076 RepID=A0A1E3X8Y9_9BACT|nr:MAG: putative orf [Candidatus Scalindua rubra]